MQLVALDTTFEEGLQPSPAARAGSAKRDQNCGFQSPPLDDYSECMT